MNICCRFAAYTKSSPGCWSCQGQVGTKMNKSSCLLSNQPSGLGAGGDASTKRSKGVNENFGEWNYLHNSINIPKAKIRGFENGPLWCVETITYILRLIKQLFDINQKLFQCHQFGTGWRHEQQLEVENLRASFWQG